MFYVAESFCLLIFAAMKTVDNISFSGKKALVRVDFNVPLNSTFHITDDTRIRAALPTLKKILEDGGSVILMSHLGRPKAGAEEKFSLAHLVAHLSKLLNKNVKFAKDCVGAVAESAASDLLSSEVLLLENLRFHPEEEKGDEAFAKQLAKLGDVYVNDAFGTAHRAHASTAVIANSFAGACCFGYLMGAELESANYVMKNAEKPFTAIMGGAKVSDKILIIERLLNRVNNLIIGGGMAYTFIKAQGGEIGSSLLEVEKIELAKELMQKAKEKGVEIHLPTDTVAADAFNENAKTQVVDIRKIPDGWMGLDIGPESAKAFSEVIMESKTILWNGPMGVFEMKPFENGTIAVANAIAEATENGAYSLIGGGDSAAAVNKLGFGKKVSYVSTGGGALLEYMEGKELPGVKLVLQNENAQ